MNATEPRPRFIPTPYGPLSGCPRCIPASDHHPEELCLECEKLYEWSLEFEDGQDEELLPDYD